MIASPATASGLPIYEMKDATIAVTKDNQGVGNLLVALLDKNGYRATLVDEVPDTADTVICLDGLDTISSIEDALSINKRIFKRARSIGKANPHKKVFVTIQNTGGYFGIKNNNNLRAWLGGIAGLTKTAAKEWPEVICKTIDLETANTSLEDLAQTIFDEMMHGGNDPEIGLPANGDRITPQLVSNKIKPRPNITMPENMRLLVTGGGHGITAACLVELARKMKLRVALCGRTALIEEDTLYLTITSRDELKKKFIADNTTKQTPKQIDAQINKIFTVRAIRKTISTLENLGSEVIYMPIDIQNYEQLKAGVENMRTLWGGIDGFIHGAAVLVDKLIIDKTDEQFDAVLATKTIGLQYLLSITQDDPLKLICLFSSVAARFGNSGQANYAVANEILNKVAQAEFTRRKSNCLVKSINWGPWETGMVNSSLKKMFNNLGIGLLSEEEGTSQFVEEILGGDAKQVEVLLGDGFAKK